MVQTTFKGHKLNYHHELELEDQRAKPRTGQEHLVVVVVVVVPAGDFRSFLYVWAVRL